jgi:hypothetical protein
MNNNKIEDLQAQIERERQRIANCKHIFGEPVYAPYEKMVPYGFKLDCHGSDCYTVPEGYNKRLTPRWKRVCTICGGEQFTEQTENIVTASHTQPKFH